MTQRTSKIELDLYEKSITHIKSMIKNQNNVAIITNHSEKFQDILSSNNFVEIIDLDSNKKFFDSEFLNSKEEHSTQLFKNDLYEIIVLDNILELLQNPSKFLSCLSQLLSSSGKIICNIQNISNIFNRIKILNGDFSNFTSNQKLNFFTLDLLLLLLSNSGFSMTSLKRIEEVISTHSKLNNYTLSPELLELFSTDPEAFTFFYVFTAIPKSIIDSATREMFLDFQKNIVSDRFKKLIENSKLNDDQTQYVENLKQTISDQQKELDEFRNSFLFKILTKLRNS